MHKRFYMTLSRVKKFFVLRMRACVDNCEKIFAKNFFATRRQLQIPMRTRERTEVSCVGSDAVRFLPCAHRRARLKTEVSGSAGGDAVAGSDKVALEAGDFAAFRMQREIHRERTR